MPDMPHGQGVQEEQGETGRERQEAFSPVPSHHPVSPRVESN